MTMSAERKNISKHIMPTSSNLLGLCFVILTLKKVWKVRSLGIFIDRLDGVLILLFLIASILSYASMRSAERSEQYEKIADVVFLVGLTLLSLIAVIMAFELT